VLSVDLSTKSIKDLFDVSYTGSPNTNSFLKFFGGAWRPGSVNWTEVTNKPNILTDEDVVSLSGDFKGSVFADDSTILVDGVNASVNLNETIDNDVIPKEGNAVDLGSPSKPFKSLYLSEDTLILGGYSLGVVDGNLKFTNTGYGPNNGLESEYLITDTSVVLNEIFMNTNSEIRFGSTTLKELYDERSVGIDAFFSFIGVNEDYALIFTNTVPATSIGGFDDKRGYVALDSNYFYYCTADYDGVTNIWKRIAWSTDTW
jgi:hypothetical protein